jgi:ribokinase
MHIIVVGSLNMDLVVRMPNIPRPGETLLGGVFMTFPGGKGANQAVSAARLGGKVTMVGMVGADAFGAELKQILVREGIDATHTLVNPKEATGVALIEVDAQGNNSIAVASGANYALTILDVEQALNSIPEFDILVMPLETPIDVVTAAAKIARKRGARVILNPAPAQHLSTDLLENIDVIVPNEHETQSLTGIQLDNADDYQKAAVDLMSKGIKNVILTLGKQGAYILENETLEGAYFLPAYSVKTMDTTAAGDCFIGALAVGLSEKMSIRQATSFASAAAAISVTRMGAQPSMPYRNEVDQFILERKK